MSLTSLRKHATDLFISFLVRCKTYHTNPSVKYRLHLWLSFPKLKSSLSSACHYHIRDIHRIRHTIVFTTASTTVISSIRSWWHLLKISLSRTSCQPDKTSPTNSKWSSSRLHSHFKPLAHHSFTQIFKLVEVKTALQTIRTSLLHSDIYAGWGQAPHSIQNNLNHTQSPP